ncbi:hypothetical protein, partial [Xenorhabdus cabanillasii]|uniref:hypothetical protein n=1 Tax=Xenorhabdus cabanillasii TaxID=351673 RepID=UPI002B417481
EAAYLTRFASGVKRLFSLFSDFPQRLVSAACRSVVAHYRAFSGADNSFFAFLLSSAQFLNQSI